MRKDLNHNFNCYCSGKNFS